MAPATARAFRLAEVLKRAVKVSALADCGAGGAIVSEGLSIPSPTAMPTCTALQETGRGSETPAITT